MGQKVGDDDCGHAPDRTNRKVDTPGQDYARHAHGDNADKRKISGNIREVLDVPELWDENSQNENHQQQGAQNSYLARKPVGSLRDYLFWMVRSHRFGTHLRYRTVNYSVMELFCRDSNKFLFSRPARRKTASAKRTKT